MLGYMRNPTYANYANCPPKNKTHTTSATAIKNCLHDVGLLRNPSDWNKELPMLAIDLPADVESRLDALAKATGRTKAFYAKKAILDYLDDFEDVHLAEQRLMDVQTGRSRTYTLDEVERDLGLAD
jgi:RHH-type transcriptional regulator, rel operon repressor / antitoxin RelB